jgi:hypothetical protein
MPKADTPGHTQLGVGTLIIDQVVRSITGRAAASDRLWVLMGYQIALAVLADLIARAATSLRQPVRRPVPPRTARPGVLTTSWSGRTTARLGTLGDLKMLLVVFPVSFVLIHEIVPLSLRRIQDRRAPFPGAVGGPAPEVIRDACRDIARHPLSRPAGIEETNHSLRLWSDTRSLTPPDASPGIDHCTGFRDIKGGALGQLFFTALRTNS